MLSVLAVTLEVGLDDPPLTTVSSIVAAVLRARRFVRAVAATGSAAQMPQPNVTAKALAHSLAHASFYTACSAIAPSIASLNSVAVGEQ